MIDICEDDKKEIYNVLKFKEQLTKRKHMEEKLKTKEGTVEFILEELGIIMGNVSTLEENNNFLFDESKIANDEYYQRYSNGVDAIGEIEDAARKLREAVSSFLK